MAVISKELEKTMWSTRAMIHLQPMKLCGYIGCPADACQEVKEIADYVSDVKGGYGAARDVIEHYFREAGLWEELVKEAYGAGI